MQSFAQRLKRPSFLNKLFFSLIALVLTVTLLLTGILLTSYYSSANDLVSRFFFNLLRQSNYSITSVPPCLTTPMSLPSSICARRTMCKRSRHTRLSEKSSFPCPM